MRQGQVKSCMQLLEKDWLQSKGTGHDRNGRWVDGTADADAGMGMLTAKESVAAAATAYVEVAGYETTKWSYPAAWSNCCDPSAER